MLRFSARAVGLGMAAIYLMQSVAAAPVSDPQIRTRTDLETYLNHFNNKRYDQQVAYYAPDVRLKLGTLTMIGHQAIKDFYRDFHMHVKEHVRLVDFVKDGNSVAVTMPVQFKVLKDYDKNGLKLKAGDNIYHVSFIFYTLQAGKIKDIRIARYTGAPTDFGPPQQLD